MIPLDTLSVISSFTKPLPLPLRTPSRLCPQPHPQRAVTEASQITTTDTPPGAYPQEESQPPTPALKPQPAPSIQEPPPAYTAHAPTFNTPAVEANSAPSRRRHIDAERAQRIYAPRRPRMEQCAVFFAIFGGVISLAGLGYSMYWLVKAVMYSG